jgi:hypothetical protein
MKLGGASYAGRTGFGVKMKRFTPDDTLPPGPGHYPLPESCNVRDAKHAHAGYASITQRKDPSF